MSGPVLTVIVLAATSAVAVAAGFLLRRLASRLGRSWLDGLRTGDTPLDAVGRAEWFSLVLTRISPPILILLALTVVVQNWVSGNFGTSLVGLITFVLGMTVTFGFSKLRGATPTADVLVRLRCNPATPEDGSFCTMVESVAVDLSSTYRSARVNATNQLKNALAAPMAPSPSVVESPPLSSSWMPVGSKEQNAENGLETSSDAASH